MSLWEGVLSLAQCNKFLTKLRSLLWTKTGLPSLSLEFNVGDIILSNNERDRLFKKTISLKSRVDMQLEIYKTISYLRQTIIARNCKVELNECLSKIAELNDIKCMYDSILSKHRFVNFSSINFLMNFDLKTKMDGIANESRCVPFMDNDEVEEHIQRLQTEIAKLEQKRDLLNNETTVNVTLPVNVAKLLGLD